jgi:hypothetical protein
MIVGRGYGFLPHQLAGCTLWLRSDLGLVFNGTTIAQWNDQSGNQYNFTQATTAKQPLYVPAGANGNPSLLFTAASSQALGISQALIDARAGCTVVIVHQFTSTGISSSTYSLAVGTASNGVGTRMVSSTQRDFVLSGVVNVGGGNGTTAWEKWIGTSVTGSQVFRANGAQLNTSASTPSVATAVTNLGTSNGSNFFDGSIAEVCFYNRVLTAAEILVLEAYLFLRYGI